MANALSRALRLADELGIFGAHTDAIDDEARAFYAKFGFTQLLDQERHLLLTIATIRKGVEKLGKK